MYMVEVDTEVCSRMPCTLMSSLRLTSPVWPNCTAWSKESELMPEAS
jgi:hypothetical protein